MGTEVRYRTYPVQVHLYCSKCAIYLKPSAVEQELHGFNYVTQEQMDEAKGFIEHNEVDGDTVVKFFGEMIWTGHAFTSTNGDTGKTETNYAFICNNPACKHEEVTNAQYPVMQNVEGRMVSDPAELSLEDQVIRDKMKNKHVGSSVLEDAEVK